MSTKSAIDTFTRYVVELVSKFEHGPDRWRVWDRDECRFVGGETTNETDVKTFCKKLNGEFADSLKKVSQ